VLALKKIHVSTRCRDSDQKRGQRKHAVLAPRGSIEINAGRERAKLPTSDQEKRFPTSNQETKLPTPNQETKLPA
jgi:hypothetical protein